MIGLTTDQTLEFVLPSTLGNPPERQVKVTARFASARQTLSIRQALDRAIEEQDDETAVTNLAAVLDPLIVRIAVGDGAVPRGEKMLDFLTLSEVAELPQAYLAHTALSESDRKKSGWRSLFPAANSASGAEQSAGAQS